LNTEVRTRLDERSGFASYHRDDAWHRLVAAQFEESIRGMIGICRKAGVPVILVKLGSNLRDCPPYKSEHSPGLSLEAERVWQTAFDAARATETHDLPRALGLYRQAEAIDPDYALLSFRLARVLDRLGRKAEALGAYLKAKDQDICPLRMVKRHEVILSSVAAETKTPLVDAADVLAARSPDRIPGYDLYLDHLHPGIGGHQKIGQELASQIRQLGLAPRRAAWSEEDLRAAYTQQLDKLGRAYLADGRRRVQWLESWARRERLFDETLPTDAPAFLRAGFRQLELDAEDAAWEAFDQALKRDASLAEALRQHEQQLVAEGRPAAAKKLRQRLDQLALATNQPSH